MSTTSTRNLKGQLSFFFFSHMPGMNFHVLIDGEAKLFCCSSLLKWLSSLVSFNPPTNNRDKREKSYFKVGESWDRTQASWTFNDYFFHYAEASRHHQCLKQNLIPSAYWPGPCLRPSVFFLPGSGLCSVLRRLADSSASCLRRSRTCQRSSAWRQTGRHALLDPRGLKRIV